MTSEGGFGLNFETQVRLMVDPLSTCISLPPNTSVLGTEKKQAKQISGTSDWQPTLHNPEILWSV